MRSLLDVVFSGYVLDDIYDPLHEPTQESQPAGSSALYRPEVVYRQD